MKSLRMNGPFRYPHHEVATRKKISTPIWKKNFRKKNPPLPTSKKKVRSLLSTFWGYFRADFQIYVKNDLRKLLTRFFFQWKLRFSTFQICHRGDRGGTWEAAILVWNLEILKILTLLTSHLLTLFRAVCSALFQNPKFVHYKWRVLSRTSQ